ncbi:ABC transporter ATP-binding protein [Acidisoma cellulosilytica]|uniref:ABC transporter ATP-binding protein n=1 Tax=Acidisoma cellulosilyticum TaxID=2802395 RepID=A0A963Z775_9PROT|nr:ABC transporter ATP-binding protein [Acidisoma cellulosilyticum]MCB8883781.1 ABC transporter ATP-binding protein [Acidisoma cellulosilyticum]
MILSIDAISKSFGGVQALDGVTFDVSEGTIFGLIGPNGAGKTTTFNMISGMLRPDSGEVRFGGKRLDKLSPDRRAGLSIARTFQHVQLMPGETVIENVMAGAHLRGRSGMMGAVLRLPRQRREELAIRQLATEALTLVGLAKLASREAGELAYGQQRLIELARALAMQPKLLLLDEPAAGLNDAETEALGVLIRRIRETGVTILLVEHAMTLVMGVSDRIAVLDFGRKIAEGSPDEIRRDQDVIAAYLGVPDDDDA